MSDPISAAGLYVPTTPTGDDTRRRLAGKSPMEVAREFEAILLSQVIGAMRRTVPESGMLEASASRKMLDGAFDQEVARSLAAKGGLGIAEQIVGQIERQAQAREAANGGTAAGVTAPVRAGVTTATSAGVASVTSTGIASAPSIGIASAPSARTASTAAHGVGAERTIVRTEPGAARAAVLPVEGEITSPFGMRSDPFTGKERFHGGVDVAAPRGTAIRAVADGEVVFSGWRRGGAGRVVEVRHANGLVTSYAHAERTLVRAGQHVVAGEAVATVGSSGRASGPHLHFAATRDGQPIDPSGLLESVTEVAGAI